MSTLKLTNSLQRGLAILEAFTAVQPRLRLQEIVAKTSLPKGTAFRFLKTLISLRYVSYDPESRFYSLTPRVMSLGYTSLATMDVREVALPFLQDLSERTGQNVNLGILDGVDVVYIERIKRQRILTIDLHVGSRLNACRTSIGQAILAYLNEGELRKIIDQAITDPEIARSIGPRGRRLSATLEDVRQRGYAIQDEQFVQGLRAIAAPVFDHENRVEAAINMPVFSQLVLREELTERYAPLLLDAAGKISAARGSTVSGLSIGRLPLISDGPKATTHRRGKT